MKNSKYRRTVVGGAALGALIAGGFATGLAAAAALGSSNNDTTSGYSTNASGQTFGGVSQTAAHEDPDLIRVEYTPLTKVAQTARTEADLPAGYVSRDLLDDVTGANVQTPEEALLWQEQQEADGWTTKSIPVVAEDGTTVLGTFEISRTVEVANAK